jgi:ribosomal protein L11 methyltransferase
MLRLAVRVEREQAEIVLAELLELAPGGVEEVAIGEDVIEYALYGAPGELPAVPDLTAAAGDALVNVSTEQVADDWHRRWREFHRPLVLDGRLAVRPPWEPSVGAEVELVIDPGQAFGTGAHATTRMCLELMLELAPADAVGSRARGRFLDLGSGSGVLAIAGAKLGWSPITALDHDRTAVEATDANAALNGVRVSARRFDMRTDQVPDCDFLAANVLAGPLRAWAASQRRMPPELILSGVLADEADAVSRAFSERGMRERERRVRAEWAALLLVG